MAGGPKTLRVFMAVRLPVIFISESDVPADFGLYERCVILSGHVDGVLIGQDSYVSLNLDNYSRAEYAAEYAKARERVFAFMEERYGIVPGTRLRRTRLGVLIQETCWVSKALGDKPVRVTWKKVAA